MTDESFFSRWSKRKAQTREGQPVEDEPAVEAAPLETAPAAAVPHEPEAAPVVQPELPPPTLEDVQSLTPQSDFRRFVGADVSPEVKNAAMKKLFADPRYNVRDSMDVYADDYTKADPLPESMLRQLAVGQVLKLFEESADVGDGKTVAQSASHADPDLRLQQHDAPAAESAGDGVERGTSASPDAVPPGSGSVPESDPG
jgi:hypothetical protein